MSKGQFVGALSLWVASGGGPTLSRPSLTDANSLKDEPGGGPNIGTIHLPGMCNEPEVLTVWTSRLRRPTSLYLPQGNNQSKPPDRSSRSPARFSRVLIDPGPGVQFLACVRACTG